MRDGRIMVGLLVGAAAIGSTLVAGQIKGDPAAIEARLAAGSHVVDRAAPAGPDSDGGFPLAQSTDGRIIVGQGS